MKKIMLALAAAVLFALPASAQNKVDAVSYCESCQLGNIALDFGEWNILAVGLVFDETSGLWTGSGHVSGKYDLDVSVSATFIDNPYYQEAGCNANPKWVGSLVLEGKGFVFISTNAGANPLDIQFGSACIQNWIEGNYDIGAPGKVKQILRQSVGTVKNGYR